MQEQNHTVLLLKLPIDSEVFQTRIYWIAYALVNYNNRGQQADENKQKASWAKHLTKHNHKLIFQ